MTDAPVADDRTIPREVRILGLVSLAQDTGSEMLYPLLPTFLTVVLGAPVVAVGVAEGLADAAAAATKLIAGRRARRGRRRKWIAVGYGLAALGKAIVAISLVWPLVLVGRVVDRLGKGIRGVPRDALIADVTTERNRGRAFGLHRSMDTLGAVVGPLLGLGLYHLLGDRVRPTLTIAVVPAIASVLLVSLVRERAAPPAPSVPPGAVASAPRTAADHGPLPPAFWRVLVPIAVFSFVNSTDALLLQRAHELGLSVTSVIAVYVLYNVVYAALGYPAGGLADRIAPRLVFAVGLLLFAVVYVGMAAATTSALVWLLLPAYGAYTALTDGVSRAWVSRTVPAEQRTWALGVHGGLTGGAALVAGLWSGLLWRGTGRFPLAVSGVVAALVGLYLLAPRSQPIG